ncbi:MAG TPA: DUF4350 domain-containing protein [Gemmatimonadales bacterium]|jgi:hypothetical protein
MSRPLEIGLVLLLVAILGATIWAGRRGAEPQPSFDVRASTFLSGPAGSRALHDVLIRLRIPVERRRAPLFDLTADARRRPTVLAVLDPPLDLESAELDQVVRFVLGGGRVVAAGWGGGITSCVGWRLVYPHAFLRGDSVPVVASRPGLVLPAVANYLRLPRRDELDTKDRRRGEDADTCDALAPVAQDTLLRLVGGDPVVLRLRYAAGGSVTLIGDVGYVRNAAWRASRVPEFVVPLLAPPRGGRLVWDEYHQGFGKGRSPTRVLATWLLESPVGWAILQVVAVVLVGIAVAAVRFGPARSVIERRRRSPLEHLEALAAGLEGAAGVDTSVALAVGGLRRRLGRGGVLRPDDQRTWLAALELALPTAAGRNAARRLQQIVSQPGGPERALAAAQAVEDVWEELRPPTTPVAS